MTQGVRLLHFVRNDRLGGRDDAVLSFRGSAATEESSVLLAVPRKIRIRFLTFVRNDINDITVETLYQVASYRELSS